MWNPRAMECTGLLTLVALARASGAAPDNLEPDDLQVPAPEIDRTRAVKPNLPPVPAFDLPPANSDGSISVKELRIRGAKLFGTDIVVKGVITWAYDCATNIRTPRESDKDVQKRIDDDPSQCERPKFYVGDSPQTPPEKSVWVVDIPRVYSKLEIERIGKQDRSQPDRCEPNEKDPKKQVCPPYKVGDEVVLVGSFKQSSPHSEHNSDGLLVYKRMKNTTQRWETPGGVRTDRVPRAVVKSSKTRSKSTKPTPVATAANPPMRKVVASANREASLNHLASANKAAAGRQFDDAVTEYQQAIAAWEGNHLAWFGMGGSQAQRGRWLDASDAFQHAAQLRPDAAMYQLWYGISVYERTVVEAREELARKENKKPEQVKPDLSAINFDDAQQHLTEATKLDDALWRAHYYLGRIFREQDQAKSAADEFNKALTANPRQSGPYIALGELYRRWDYDDQAIQVASYGTVNVPGPNDVSDIWYVLGMGYDDKRMNDKAIDAFTKAIDTKKDNYKAAFQRGLAYFRKGDFVNARRDLEDFSKNAGGTSEFAKQQASRMLMDIASKSPPSP